MIEELIRKNEKLIYSIINKYTYYFDKDDLYQVAVIGLMEALKNYKNDKNTKFTSYAYFYIKGNINKYIRETNYFKVSKELVKLNKSIENAKEVLTRKLQRNVSYEEICLFLNISYQDLIEAKEANLLVESLDDYNQDERSAYEMIGETPKEYNEEIMDLKEEISKLDDRDKKLLRSRYEYGMTQSETSEELGMSQVQVSRQEKKILTRLRKTLS